jgi:hypothetical protein
MHGLTHMLVQSLASDNLWPAFVFLAALVTIASLRTMGKHIAGRRHKRLRRAAR